MRCSEILGRTVSGLGALAGVSVLGAAALFILPSLIPGFTFTNGTFLFHLVPALLAWICFPAWLLVLAARIRATP
jgi:hypothetical protein